MDVVKFIKRKVHIIMSINKKIIAVALSAVMVAAPVSQVGQCFAADENAISQVVNVAENKLIDENSNESVIILEADKSQEVVSDEKASSEDKAIEKVTVKKSKKETLKNFWNKYKTPIKITASILGGALAAYFGYKGVGAIKGMLVKPIDTTIPTNTTIPTIPVESKEVKIEAPVVTQPIITDGNNSTSISNSSTYDANTTKIEIPVAEQEEVKIEEVKVVNQPTLTNSTVNDAVDKNSTIISNSSTSDSNIKKSGDTDQKLEKEKKEATEIAENISRPTNDVSTAIAGAVGFAGAMVAGFTATLLLMIKCCD